MLSKVHLTCIIRIRKVFTNTPEAMAISPHSNHSICYADRLTNILHFVSHLSIDFANGHLNDDTNGDTKGNANGHASGDSNGCTNGYTSSYINGYTNGYVNEPPLSEISTGLLARLWPKFCQ